MSIIFFAIFLTVKPRRKLKFYLNAKSIIIKFSKKLPEIKGLIKNLQQQDRNSVQKGSYKNSLGRIISLRVDIDGK
jgi:hypothetical protein